MVIVLRTAGEERQQKEKWHPGWGKATVWTGNKPVGLRTPHFLFLETQQNIQTGAHWGIFCSSEAFIVWSPITIFIFLSRRFQLNHDFWLKKLGGLHFSLLRASYTLESSLRKREYLSVLGIKNHHRGKAQVFFHKQSAAWNSPRLWRLDLTSPRLLLNGFLENVCATSTPEAKRWRSRLARKAIEVRPITLAIATCQMEQIEFVFLRCLVGALNSVLVALLIKAVKPNLFSCERRRLRSASFWHYIKSCRQKNEFQLFNWTRKTAVFSLFHLKKKAI